LGDRNVLTAVSIKLGRIRQPNIAVDTYGSTYGRFKNEKIVSGHKTCMQVAYTPKS